MQTLNMEKMRKVQLIGWRRAATVGFKERREQKIGGEVAEARAQQNILSQVLTWRAAGS